VNVFYEPQHTRPLTQHPTPNQYTDVINNAFVVSFILGFVPHPNSRVGRHRYGAEVGRLNAIVIFFIQALGE